MLKYLKIQVLIYLIGLFYQTGLAQPVIKTIQFNNPSFEGPPAPGKPPPQWRVCNILSTPDTQPGYFGVFNAASDGKTFLGLISREDGSYEAVAQDLGTALQKGKRYCFSMDLGFNDEKLNDIRKPGIVRVWGTGSGSCDNSELLWTSPVIEHTEWKKYQACFTPTKEYAALIIETYYAQLPFYKGQNILDNLSAIEYLENWQKSICAGDSLQVSALPQGEKSQDWLITWKAGKNILKNIVSEKIYVKKAGEYEAELRKSERVYKSILTVEVSECEAKLIIPNLITPNGDKFNETFEIKGILPAKWKIKIYNRWGKQVFQSEGYNNEWAGEADETGTYYYHLQDTESERKYTGFVMVMR